ncbi:MAG: hypothetical protein ABW321_31840 [Polyangiales bacterium]
MTVSSFTRWAPIVRPVVFDVMPILRARTPPQGLTARVTSVFVVSVAALLRLSAKLELVGASAV